MRLETPSFAPQGPIADTYGFCKPDLSEHVAMSDNVNPAFRWSELPPGARSLVLICHDSDAPTDPTNVNREGVTVPADLPRVDFYHWVLVDLPTSLNAIQEGEFCRGVTPRGKAGPAAHHGARQGINDYTGWFAGDADMEGTYHGYDGPCPPWNDELVHHYHFTLYALDVSVLELPDGFGGPQVLEAMDGHILAKARVTGTYTLNPTLRVGTEHP